MAFVCPQPIIWNSVYTKLSNFYSKNKNVIKTPPPKILILNGWIYSTDYQKKIRWEETLKWAEVNKCNYLIPLLKETEKYIVDKVEQTFIQKEDPCGSLELDDEKPR